jgi:hypothetical protein
MSLNNSIIEIFNLTWDMFKEATEQIPEEHWRKGEIGYLIPSRLVYHVLDSTDFYLSEDPEGYDRGYRYKLNWREASAEELPTNEQSRKYLDEIRAKFEKWINELTIFDLSSGNENYPWTGTTRLSRILYVLAHCRQHLGEINAELRRRGLARVKWKTY